MSRMIAVFGAASVALSFTLDARADEPGFSGPTSDPPLPFPRPQALGRDDLIDMALTRTWRDGAVRPFLAMTLDVGWVYLRPRLSAGYGRPFDSWLGVDANPIIAGTGLGVYGGLRFALPRLDFRVGTRYFGAFNRAYLTPQESYERLDLNATVNAPSRVLTYEAELEGSLPVGPGDIVGLGSASYVANVPDGLYVFEETLRVVVDPPLLWRARAGYLFRFGVLQQHSIGIVADVLHVPRRHDSTTVRVGPVIRIVLSRHVDIRGSFVPTIMSPDNLGLAGGDFTELGFRYRWASE